MTDKDYKADNKMEKVIGIGDKLREMDKEDLSDEEKRKKHEERKERVGQIKAEIKKLRNTDSDEEFIKDSLKELATIGLESMRVLQDEVEVDATGRTVECMAAMANATSKALKDLQNVDIDKEKLNIDKEKLEIKKTAAALPGNTTNNILVTGSVTDLVKTLKDGGFENQEEIDAEIIHEEEVKNRTGTPFPKKD